MRSRPVGATAARLGLEITSAIIIAALGYTPANASALGVAAGTSLALGGATIGSNALAVTGTSSLAGSLTMSNTSDIIRTGAYGIFNNTGSTADFKDPTNATYTGIRASTAVFSSNVTALTLALGGATIGSNALAVTGTTLFNGAIDASSVAVSMSSATIGQLFSTSSNAGTMLFRNAAQTAAVQLNWNTNGILKLFQSDGSTAATLQIGSDLILNRAAAANLQLGAAAVDTAPVAQTLSVQNTLAGGTSNVAGANFTIAGSQGKGTGVGGSIIFQTAAAGSTGTTVNALVAGLTIDSTQAITVGGSKVFFGTGSGNTALLKASGATLQARLFADNAYTFLQGKITSEQNATTGLTAGVLAALTNASVVFYDATGQAYRFPCII